MPFAIAWQMFAIDKTKTIYTSTSAYRQLRLDGQSQKEDRKAALNAALGGMWHEERAHSAFQVGNTCVRSGEGVENLERIVFHCPHWNKERCEAGLPSHAQEAQACVRLHGLLPAPPPGALPAHEPPLVMRAGVHTVWTDGSGRHSSNPHFRRCGERCWLALPWLSAIGL
eukprot:6479084-Amphidinium_carterae.1